MGNKQEGSATVAAITTRKKQLIWFVPIILLLIVMAINITLDSNKPYKEITLGETSLFVPKNYLPKQEPDIVNMVRDHLSQKITRQLKLTSYADEILPKAADYGASIGGSSIIWTIEPSEQTEIKPSADDTSVSYTEEPDSGLFKAVNKQDTSVIAYAVADQTSANGFTMLAQCVELKTIRPGGTWGRCSKAFNVNGLTVRVHFDGRLVRDALDISDSTRELVTAWLKEPTS
jgi:hypothetical protein